MKKMRGVSILTSRHAIALMPLAALAVSIDRAEAASGCDAISPIATATTVTCTGTNDRRERHYRLRQPYR